MKFLRNPEVVRPLYVFATTSVVATTTAFLWETRFGWLVLMVCFVLFLVHTVSTYKRYKRLWDLSADINDILHRKDGNIAFDKYAEGELAVLQSEIHKMTNCLKEQKEQLQKDKTYLAHSIADISHQIRTPLTSINLLVQFLSKPDLTNQRRMELTHELMGLLSRIDWLINTLLKISQLDAGTVRFKQEIIPLYALIDRSTAPLLVPIELRGQNLVIHADGQFSGDVSWTSEAIGNIVKNCMEHTPKGGTMDIRASENVLYSEIAIADTGCGIDPEDLPHIFERFYKGKNSSDKSFGIGLALARMIVTLQNGTVKVENVEPNGTLFTIRFYKGTV